MCQCITTEEHYLLLFISSSSSSSSLVAYYGMTFGSEKKQTNKKFCLFRAQTSCSTCIIYTSKQGRFCPLSSSIILIAIGFMVLSQIPPKYSLLQTTSSTGSNYNLASKLWLNIRSAVSLYCDHIHVFHTINVKNLYLGSRFHILEQFSLTVKELL